MSYDFSILLHHSALPSRDALGELLASRRPPMRLTYPAAILEHVGFYPVELDGRATGFEIYRGAIDDARRQDYADDLRESGEVADGYGAVLERCDVSLSLVCHDDLEIAAARAFALALAELSRGYFLDPQTAESIDFAAAPLPPRQ